MPSTLQHYALDNDKLDAFASTAINAAKSVWQHYHTMTREMIVEMIKKAEKSGMKREKLVSTLKNKWLKVEWIEEVIDELIVEGRCYEADHGVLKVMAF